MKRIITAFLAVLMIGTAALATVSAATNKVDGRLTAEAYIADIKVDGQIEAAWMLTFQKSDGGDIFSPLWAAILVFRGHC